MKTRDRRSAAEQERCEAALFEAVSLIRNSDEAEVFLRDLCTPAELEALADRWCVVALLREGRPYREINDLTGVSVTTIGRVARFLARGHGGYQLVAGRLGDDPDT
jgi:TrpR-related protein YerC/YecD